MPKLVGINHVALEVGDIDEALEWYGKIFDLALRGRMGNAMAFVDMGDQFIALSRGRTQPPDLQRHFGLVVDDKEAVREALVAAGVPVPAPPGNTPTTMRAITVMAITAPGVTRVTATTASTRTATSRRPSCRRRRSCTSSQLLSRHDPDRTASVSSGDCTPGSMRLR